MAFRQITADFPLYEAFETQSAVLSEFIHLLPKIITSDQSLQITLINKKGHLRINHGDGLFHIAIRLLRFLLLRCR